MENKEEIILNSWKGKDEISIFQNLGSFKVVEHRKNKETGEVVEQEHIVTMENYLKLKQIIDGLNIGYKVGYRYIVNKIISDYGIEVDIEAFNGGKNRARYYFPLYYYPMKVLESKGIVLYFGRGGCERIK